MALANALDGMRRAQAAHQAEMDRQALRDWVIRFNTEGVEDLRDRPKSGRPSWLDDGQLGTFKALVLRGPERDGVRATPRPSPLEGLASHLRLLVRLGGRATRMATAERDAGFAGFFARGSNLPERSAPALVVYARWLHAGVTMALPSYVLQATSASIVAADVTILLGAQTAGVPCCRTHFGAGGGMSAPSRACSRA